MNNKDYIISMLNDIAEEIENEYNLENGELDYLFQKAKDKIQELF